MSSNNNNNEIERITQRLAAIELEKTQLTQKLSTLQSIAESNQQGRNEDTLRVTASDLAIRTGVRIPPKYHRFANLIRKDKNGKRLYVGDKVEVHTRNSRTIQRAVVAYITECKVTVVHENGVKVSREASYLKVTEPFDRKGKPL